MRIIKPSKRPGSGRLNRQAHSSSRKDDESGFSQDQDELDYREPSLDEEGSHGLRLDLSSSFERTSSERTSSADRTQEVIDNTLDVRKKQYSVLLSKAVRLLAMREHSVKELHAKLATKADGFVDLVDAVIEEMLKQGYLSNERYAESYTRSRLSRGFGPVKIRLELQNKGIEPSLIEEHIDSRSAHWLDVALEQHHKKYGDTPVSDYSDWTKRARFLQGRGFTMEHIHSVVPAVIQD